ncbi:MAG TPA: hypothetical protein VIB59_00700 [Solirubrobacteraceae bacterium]|jgi:hypothetical protein
MPLQLFVFLQLEFPWALGPADGRYLLRDGPGGEPERVVVVETLRAGRAEPVGEELRGGWPFGAQRRRARERDVAPEPAPVEAQTTRVTVIDPVPLSAEGQARAWLEELDRERDVQAAVEVLNRVVHLHRIAAADPYVREVAAAQALVIRAGWGEGEQVAYGRWRHARELPARPRRRRGSRRRDRTWALRPQERLAALLGGRGTTLLCEELVLRARLDLDQNRPAHAAVGLDRALAAAVGELTAEGRQDLAVRIAELDQLRAPVGAQAQAALAAADAAAGGDGGAALDEELLGHALGRLEAALRARTAAGV